MRERVAARDGRGLGGARLQVRSSLRTRVALAGLATFLALWLEPTGQLRAEDKPAAAGATRLEPALPRLAGPRLGGGQASTDIFRKRRGVLFVFASTDPG